MLSTADAEEILLKTKIFGFSGPNRHIYAYNVVFDEPDALARFQAISEHAGFAGQLYALIAFQTLDATAAADLTTRLSMARGEVLMSDGHLPAPRPVADVVDLIRNRQFATEFRRVRYHYPWRAPRLVTFPTQDGWDIYADLYEREDRPASDRGLVLVHGGRFTKDSWQGLAMQAANAGFRVLAIDLRGYGLSKNGPTHQNPDGFGSPLDVLAAVRYLRAAGATSVSIIGASMGADAAAGASILARPSEIDGLVLLAGSGSEPADRLKGRKLFIVAHADANSAGLRLPAIRAQYERASPPKELLILDGAEHAQFLFQSDQQGRLTDALWQFLRLTR